MAYQELSRRVLDQLKVAERSSGAFDMATLDTWDWPQGVALYAMMKVYQRRGDETFLEEVKQMIAMHLQRELPPRNINTTAVMLTVVELYALNRQPKLHRLIADWAEWVMIGLGRTEGGGFQHATIESANAGQLWDDTLYMTGLFLYRAGMVLNRPEWCEEAKFQFMFHIHYLQNVENGLFYHGFNFAGRHHFGKALWARGNGWITAGCVDLLEWLPQEDPAWRFIYAAWKAQCEALLHVQDTETGRWHTLLDQQDSYLETSASAAITYGMLKGIRLGLLGEEYRAAAERGVRGVMAMVREDGMVEGVSNGTAAHESLDYYRHITLGPTAYGQGLVFLMLTEAE